LHLRWPTLISLPDIKIRQYVLYLGRDQMTGQPTK
jgi:hypothetical protein